MLILLFFIGISTTQEPGVKAGRYLAFELTQQNCGSYVRLWYIKKRAGHYSYITLQLHYIAVTLHCSYITLQSPATDKPTLLFAIHTSMSCLLFTAGDSTTQEGGAKTGRYLTFDLRQQHCSSCARLWYIKRELVTAATLQFIWISLQLLCSPRLAIN